MDYKPIQREFLRWIDSRMETGVSVEKMNDELEAAGLLSNGPQSVNDWFDKTYVGFFGDISVRSVPGTADLLAITIGIHTGAYCNFDETVVLYQRKPKRRIAVFNAEPSYTHGYYLRQFTVGNGDLRRGRLTGSSWVASNCTSNWNGNRFRIDIINGSSIENVGNWGVGAFNGKEMTINTKGDTVTFNYATGTGESVVMIRDAIAAYRVQRGRAIRQPPIAPSFGGFISEWLDMDETEATRWSNPEAAMYHQDLAQRHKQGLFAWERVANCPGSPPAREVSVLWDKSKLATVFRITGATAAEMRMEAVLDRPSAGCNEIDLTNGFPSLFSEPAR